MNNKFRNVVWRHCWGEVESVWQIYQETIYQISSESSEFFTKKILVYFSGHTVVMCCSSISHIGLSFDTRWYVSYKIFFELLIYATVSWFWWNKINYIILATSSIIARELPITNNWGAQLNLFFRNSRFDSALNPFFQSSIHQYSLVYINTITVFMRINALLLK